MRASGGRAALHAGPASRAARVEAAAGGRPERRRHGAGDAGQLLGAVGMAGEQEARVGVLGIIEDRAHGSGLDGLAGVHDGHPVAELGDDAEVVRDEQHRQVALGGKVAQELEDLQLRRDVERGGGLVGQHDAGGAGERGGDQQALALAAGELVGIARERLLGIGELHVPQERDEVGAHGAAVGARRRRPRRGWRAAPSAASRCGRRG